MRITQRQALDLLEKRNDSLPGAAKWRRRDYLLWLFSVLTVIIGIRFTVLTPVQVKGSSMEPTLMAKDYMLMERVSYFFRGNMRRGDILICNYPQNDEYSCVKRLIGLPGETVELLDGTVYINGAALREDYVVYPSAGRHDGSWTVPEDCVFVLGDNRRVSRDSSSVGCIPIERVLGRVPLRIFPLKAAQRFKRPGY